MIKKEEKKSGMQQIKGNNPTQNAANEERGEHGVLGVWVYPYYYQPVE
jgi:hypothetical protein